MDDEGLLAPEVTAAMAAELAEEDMIVRFLCNPTALLCMTP